MKCTLCDERRVAEPAYYCDRACQKSHWPEHKAFHARLEIDKSKKVKSDPEELMADLRTVAASGDQCVSLLAHAEQARLRGEYREAVKWAKKAIAVQPTHPEGYFYLARAYADSGDYTNAVPQLLKTMDLMDTGTRWNRQFGDEKWARAASLAYSCLVMCDAPKPAWFTDTQQLKRMADRAVAAVPDDFNTLQMRIKVYQRTPIESWSMDDLRQVLRDARGVLASLKEDIPAYEQNSRVAAYVEVEIRMRIAADLAALKLADD